ncbi:hypothetical protein [Trujillonella humicola]|uniref:hypothetical protein n=1 Tax=Trujillonella humicola TaxID=3383699 RepID=UPI003905F7D8
MASTTLDDRTGVRPAGGAAASPHRRPPAAVLAAAGIALLEAVAVVAAAITGLDGLLTAPDRPPTAVSALLLVALAAWAVFGAGGGLVLADGSGARLLTVVACAELAVLAVVLVLGLTTTTGPVLGLPLAALALSAFAVPTGKLLLASAPSTMAWLAAGPRSRTRPPELTEDQRSLRLATVAVIGLALVAVTLLDPAGTGADVPAPAATGRP